MTTTSRTFEVRNYVANKSLGFSGKKKIGIVSGQVMVKIRIVLRLGTGNTRRSACKIAAKYTRNT